MNHYVEACTDEERSRTTDCSASMDIEPGQQIPSTVEFATHAEPLPSTMETMINIAKPWLAFGIKKHGLMKIHHKIHLKQTNLQCTTLKKFMAL